MLLKSTVAKRVFFGSLLIVAVVAVVLLDGWFSCSNDIFVLPGRFRGIGCGLILFLLAAGGCVEIRRLAQAKRLNPSLSAMILAVGLMMLHPYLSGSKAAGAAGMGLTLMAGMLGAGLFQALKNGNEGTLGNLAITCFTAIYLGLGCWFVLAIRLLGRDSTNLWGQTGSLLLFLACVKSSDIGAYFTGRFLGRHKWVPAISPGKTWEGFIGGVILSMIVASLFAVFSGIIGLSKALLFGWVVSVVGQLGDLLESMLKRDANSKDSARLIPEFGGVLDLLDSVVVAAPFAYVMLVYMGR